MKLEIPYKKYIDDTIQNAVDDIKKNYVYIVTKKEYQKNINMALLIKD